MAYFYIRLCVILYLARWPGVEGQDNCPAECQCQDSVATCSSVKGTISSPFPDNVVNVTIDRLSKMSALGPNLFGKYTENILIQASTIEEISPHAFSNMQSVKSIRFSDVFITTVRSCAFTFIQSPAVIEFRSANIDKFEPGAVSDMPGLKEITFALSTVTNIESHAFLNIRTRNFTIFDTEISVLATASINSLSNVDVFQFLKATISTVKAGAFSNITKIDTVRIEMCRFVELQCNALMELREATQGTHDTFTFTNSSLVCNCSVVDMLDYSHSNQNALSNSVVCVIVAGRQTPQRQSLTSLTSRDICPSLDDAPRCSIIDSSPPTCKVETAQTTTPRRTDSTSTTTTLLFTTITTPSVHVTRSTTPENKATSSLSSTANVFALLLMSGLILILL